MHLIPTLSACGDAAQLLTLAKNTPNEETVIFTFAPVPDSVRDALRNSPQVTIYECRTHFRFEPFLAVLRGVRKLKIRPKVVHVWGEPLAAAGLCLAELFHARSILTLRHFDPWRRPNAGIIRRFDAVLTNSSSVQRAYENRNITANWRVLHDCLSEPVSSKTSARADRTAFLEEWNLPSDALLALCVGPAAPWKRWNWAVWTIDSIVRVHPEMHLFFFEPGPQKNLERRLVERFVHQYERDEIVHWVPFREDFSELLPFFDFFWNPQSVPGAGLAMLEAAAAGVPIVCAQTEDFFEILPENAASFVPAEHETTALASASHLLCVHPETRDAQVSEAMKFVSNMCNIQKYIEKYQILIK